MRDFLKSSGPRSSGGWFSFWAAVLLILPNCSFSLSVGPGDNLEPGSSPHSGAIFCDIAMERRCATPDDLMVGTRLKSAAVALVAGRPDSNIGLDYSPAALASCGGVPEAVVFQGAFPQGSPVCVNCGETLPPDPAAYPNTFHVCQRRCHDLFGTTTSDGIFVPQNPPSADTITFCLANARESTNILFDTCFDGACTVEGTLDPNFVDPRRTPEPVDWVNLVGVIAAGGTLTRTAPFTGTFDAGASSSQLITAGDGYVEFTATETNTIRIAGLSSGPPPGSLTFNDIGFGIELYNTGEIFVFENGSAVNTFGAYTTGQKFRVKVQDRFDGTATVSYARINGPCTDGSPCSETVFFTSANTVTYPVRVDAMFFELGATVTEARMVRIR